MNSDIIESSRSLVAPKIARPLAPGWLASDGDPDADAVLTFFSFVQVGRHTARDALAPFQMANLMCLAELGSQTAGKQRVRGMCRSWHFLATHFSLHLGVHAFELSCPSMR
jgi:hypothetical protein